GAVGEGDVLTQVEDVLGGVLRDVPGLGEPRVDLPGLGVLEGELVGDLVQDGGDRVVAGAARVEARGELVLEEGEGPALAGGAVVGGCFTRRPGAAATGGEDQGRGGSGGCGERAAMGDAHRGGPLGRRSSVQLNA